MCYGRLKKQSDFDRIFKSGKRAFASSLTLVYKPSKEPLMGISVGKRHGKSVQRNRIKRLLREAFRSEMGEIQGTYHIVLLPKAGEKYSYHTFKTHLQCMIKKEKM